MTIRRFLFRSSGVVAAIVAVAWFWLLHTESGMHWLWNQARGAIAGELDARSVSGDLSSGVALRYVTLHTSKLTVTVDRIDVTIDFDILPLSLEIETLKLATMLVHLSDDNSSASDLVDRRQVLESLSLPVRLFVSDAKIDDLSIEGLVENRNIYLETLTLRAEMKDQLHVDRLRISAAEGSADVRASLDLRRPFSSSIAGQIELQPLLTGYDKTIEANLSASGDLTAMTIVIDTAGLDTHLEGSIGNLLTGPAWDLSLDVPAYEQVLSDSQSLRAQGIAVTSAGTINQYSLHASASLELSGFEPAVVSATGTGSLHAIKVSSLAIENELFSASVTGEAHWTPSAKLVADVRLNRLNPRMFMADWPAAESIFGRVSLQLDDHRVLLQDATLRIAERDTLLNFSASVDLETTRVESQLEWRNVRWRADETAPPIISERGSAVIAGTLDDWKLRSDIGIRVTERVDGNFVLSGTGNRESMALQIEKGDVFGGSARGELEYSWLNEQSIEADLQLGNVSFGAVFPEWPGTVTGGIAIDGQLQPLRLDVSLREIAGSLRGASLKAKGEVTFGNGELLVDDLNIAHGASRVHLDGSLFTPDGLSFDFILADLGHYLDDFRGPFNAVGKVSLAGSAPALRIDASSDAIGYRDYRLSGMRIQQPQNEAYLITADELS
ncbi:MAG: hypothetical protein GXP15_13760, partial [Gammaproteobacteria bacterium]|nr:hypothetical protein [Gammaproteobacteria bacterium]